MTGCHERGPDVVMEQTGLGVAQCVSSTPSQTALSTWVECCLIDGGSGQIRISGMCQKALEESASLAWQWVRLMTDTITQALGFTIIQKLDVLPFNRDLLIHVSPGSAASWKSSSVGAAIAIAMVSLMIGVFPKQGVGVEGELANQDGAMGEIGLLGDLKGFFDNMNEVQQVTCLVVGRGTAERLEMVAERHAVQVMGVKFLAESLPLCFPSAQESHGTRIS